MSPHHRNCSCYDCTQSRVRRNHRLMLTVIIVAAVIGIGAVTLLFTGCAGTATPAAVHSEQASFDGGQQTSGILGLSPGGFSVTAHFRDRYNALVSLYGAAFLPPLKTDSGLAIKGDGTWTIDAEHMAKFVTMNTWKKTGRAPSKP